jgi:WD40 repeat protein
LGQVERLPRRVGWCIASPDETTILAAEPMVEPFNSLDRNLWWKRFVPSISIWDAKSGVRKHLFPVPEAEGYPIYIHEWYARWLDNSRALHARLERQNPSRAACNLRLIIIDTVAGKVAKSSKELEWAGEHLFLSPDQKMALTKDDNYVCRDDNYVRRGIEHGWKAVRRNIYARVHVFDLEQLSVLSSWREPPSSPDKDEDFALIARWCPDGKTVLTVDGSWADDHHSPKIRFWDARTARLLRTLSGHKDYILDVALTSTGDKLLTASDDRTVRVWDTRTGSLDVVFSGHTAGLNKVIVLPGDKLVVSAAEESVAKVWDLRTGKLKFDLPDHDSAVRDVEMVSGNVVRTVTQQGTSTIWDCSTGKLLQTIPKPPDYPKRFGACELVVEGKTLHMRILDER